MTSLILARGDNLNLYIVGVSVRRRGLSECMCVRLTLVLSNNSFTNSFDWHSVCFTRLCFGSVGALLKFVLVKMAKLLLLADSNYAQNIRSFQGTRIKNLQFVECQSKRAVLTELGSVYEGIVVIANLDNVAAEAAKGAIDAQDRAVELHLEHLLLKVMERLEEADGRLVCVFFAPIYWKSHSEQVRSGLAHAYELYQKSPITNLILTTYAPDLKVGPDGVHLIPHAANKFIERIHQTFVRIDQDKGWNLAQVEASTGSVSWADDEEQRSDEFGTPLVPPTNDVSPSRTLSMVSMSMLPSRSLTLQGPRTLNTTQHRLFDLVGSGTGANATPIRPRGPFLHNYQMPPPSMPMRTAPAASQPSTWPTMLTPELNSSLDKISLRVGYLETKSFHDNLMMAALKEAEDTEANRAMLNRVTVIGIKILDFHKMSNEEKVEAMKAKAQEVFDELAETGQKFEPVFVRHLNRKVRGQDSLILEVKLATEKQAIDLRANYVKKREGLGSINIVPVTRLSTRVRIEILQAVAPLVKRQDRSVSKVQCLQFQPKPVLKITKTDNRGNEAFRMMPFIECVTWIKENGLEKAVDLSKAYNRAGASFRGIMSQTFVLLE